LESGLYPFINAFFKPENISCSQNLSELGGELKVSQNVNEDNEETSKLSPEKQN